MLIDITLWAGEGPRDEQNGWEIHCVVGHGWSWPDGLDVQLKGVQLSCATSVSLAPRWQG